MQCMEVWGGNQLVDANVVLNGLDAWVYSKPYGGSQAGGGDVYFVSACATGRINRLLVADVSGHGATVSETAANLRTLMRRYVNYIDQTQFVAAMNQQFAAMAKIGTFATAIVTTFFAPNRHLSLCNAGHPPPIVYRGKSNRWDLLDRARHSDEAVGNIPLGIEGELSSYDQFEVRLDVGDLVLCYTDSLIESRRGDGEMLCTQGLLEIVRALDATNPGSVIPSLLASIAALNPTNLDAADDVTVLLFRPNGTGSVMSLANRVMAPVRVLGGAWRALRGEIPMPWPELSIANIGGAILDPLGKLWKGKR